MHSVRSFPKLDQSPSLVAQGGYLNSSIMAYTGLCITPHSLPETHQPCGHFLGDALLQQLERYLNGSTLAST